MVDEPGEQVIGVGNENRKDQGISGGGGMGRTK